MNTVGPEYSLKSQFIYYAIKISFRLNASDDTEKWLFRFIWIDGTRLIKVCLVLITSFRFLSSNIDKNVIAMFKNYFISLIRIQICIKLKI